MTGAAAFRRGARAAAAESAAPERGGFSGDNSVQEGEPCASAPALSERRRPPLCARRRMRSRRGVGAYAQGAGPAPPARRPNGGAHGKRCWAGGPRPRAGAGAKGRRRGGLAGGAARLGPSRLPAGTRLRGGSACMSLRGGTAGREVPCPSAGHAGAAAARRGRAALAAPRAGLAAPKMGTSHGSGGGGGQDAQRGSGAGRT